MGYRKNCIFLDISARKSVQGDGDMRKLLILAVTFAAMGTFLAGCNTVEGIGRDIERAGENLQNL